METTSKNLEHPLFKELLKLNIPNDDYAVFMSGVLFVHGIRKEINDLDIISTGRSWEAFSKITKPVVAPAGVGNYIKIETEVGVMDIYDCWYPTELWEGIDIIGSAELIGEIPFASLEHVRRFKEWRSKEKDLRDLKMMDEYLDNVTSLKKE